MVILHKGLQNNAHITIYERRSKGDHLGSTFSKHPKAWRKLGAQPAQGKTILGARFAQGLYCFLCKQPASTPASQHAHHPASQPPGQLDFLHFCSPGFAQAPRKVWRKVYKFFSPTPVFDSKGTSASNHSCIKPARASLLVAPISLSLCPLQKIPWPIIL